MHPIENIMQTSVEQIKNMVDVNTVVGDPVMTENKTMVLPVSELSLGFLVGGGEYGNLASAKKAADEAFKDARFPFAGASAVGMNIKPLAFVAVEEGNVRVLPADEKRAGDRLMDVLPRIMNGIDKLIEAGIECLKNKKGCSFERADTSERGGFNVKAKENSPGGNGNKNASANTNSDEYGSGGGNPAE